MEQSLIAATSGIQANQTYLDVIGNNIANANTTGYKSQTIGFTDLLAEQIAGASAPTATSGGVNPLAIGAGVRVGAVTDQQTQGPIQNTNVPTDVAIQGNGFLIASQAGQTYYTRNGQLSLDANGDLTTMNGALVQGWMANASGVINTAAPTTNITIPTSGTLPATATTQITLGGNLDAAATSPVSFTYNAYDSLGNAVPVTLTFTPTGTANQWNLQASVPNGTGGSINLFGGSGATVTFSSSGSTAGQITGITAGTTSPTGTVSGTASTGLSIAIPTTNMPSSYTFASGATIALDFPPAGSTGQVTQDSVSSTIKGVSQNGHAAGSLQSFSIGADGTILGSFSNGQSQTIGQIALATFANPAGLSSNGNLMYQASANSGGANVSAPGSGGAGTLVGGALEGSNVDLSTQLTDLIVAQEAYQANTKVITTTDTTIQSLMQVP